MGNGNSSVSPALLEEKHVAIIGGGYGGIALASTLQKNQIPFTLIDPKDCFHHRIFLPIHIFEVAAFFDTSTLK